MMAMPSLQGSIGYDRSLPCIRTASETRTESRRMACYLFYNGLYSENITDFATLQALVTTTSDPPSQKDKSNIVINIQHEVGK